jgi:hypothetical protein
MWKPLGLRSGSLISPLAMVRARSSPGSAPRPSRTSRGRRPPGRCARPSRAHGDRGEVGAAAQLRTRSRGLGLGLLRPRRRGGVVRHRDQDVLESAPGALDQAVGLALQEAVDLLVGDLDVAWRPPGFWRRLVRICMRVSSRKSSKRMPPASRRRLELLQSVSPLRSAMLVIAWVRVPRRPRCRASARCIWRRLRISRSSTCLLQDVPGREAVPAAGSTGG